MDINTDVLKILQNGTITLHGEFIWGSNYTFLVQVGLEGNLLQAVYKPNRGERPLWDFPPASLARRETAAFVLSELLGWGMVPPTVYRDRGPLGAGSLQLFIDHSPEYHYFTFTHEDIQCLRPVALFDMLANNADRKGSHILKDPQGQLWLIDHGVCFHREEKLRTVIWNFVGEPLPEKLCADINGLANKLEAEPEVPIELFYSLSHYLSRAEIRALITRARRIVSSSVFPAPDPSRRPFPWPQI